MQVEDLYVQSIVQLTLINNAISRPHARDDMVNKDVHKRATYAIVFNVSVMYRLNRPSHR